MALRSNYLRQLEAFCETAQTGSISKAAARLKLTQPTVSQLIRALERDLDVELFERRGPRIKLNTVGRTLLDSALPLVQEIERLPDMLHARIGTVSTGRLDIAAGESTILYLLPNCVKRFRETYPSVDLHLHNVTGANGMQMLRSGDVDFAIGSIFDVPDDIIYVPMFSYSPRLITAPDHPLATRDQYELADISRYDLILPPRHLNTWHLIDLVFSQHGLECRVALEIGGWEVIKRFVEANIGISIVTSICLCGEERLVSRPADRWFPSRTYGAVIRRGRILSPQARAFLELLDPDFGEHWAEAEAHVEERSRENRSGGLLSTPAE